MHFIFLQWVLIELPANILQNPSISAAKRRPNSEGPKVIETHVSHETKQSSPQDINELDFRNYPPPLKPIDKEIQNTCTNRRLKSPIPKSMGIIRAVAT